MYHVYLQSLMFQVVQEISIEMSEFLLKDVSDKEDENLPTVIDSMFNISNIIYHSKVNNPRMMFADIPIPNELDFVVPNMAEHCMSDHPDSPQKKDSSIPILSEQKQPHCKLGNGDPNMVYNAFNNFSCIMDLSPVEEIEETSLDSMLQAVGAEDYYSKSSVDHQFDSPNLISSNIKKHFLDHHQAGLDSHNTDEGVIFAEEMASNGISIVGNPKSSDIRGFQGTGISNDYSSLDSTYVKNSCCIQDNVEKPTVISDGVQKWMESPIAWIQLENKETDITSPDDVHVRFVEIDFAIDQQDAMDMAKLLLALLLMMMKQKLLHDIWIQQIFVPNSYIALEVENSLNLVNTTVIKISSEKRGLYIEHESEATSSLPSRIEDTSYLPIN